jgi:hypothetical protein
MSAGRLVLLCAIPLTAVAQPRVPPLHGIAVDETLGAPSVLAEAVPSGDTTPTAPLLVRLTIDPTAFAGPASAAAFAQLDARVALYRARGITVVLALGQFPASESDVESWRQRVRSIADHVRARVAAYQIGDVSSGPLPAPDRYAYLLKLAAVQIHSVDAGARVLEGPVAASAADWQDRVYAQGIAPYADGLVLDGPGQSDTVAFRTAVEDMTRLVDRQDPSASVLVGPVALSDQPAVAAAQLVDAMLPTLGTKVGVTIFQARAASFKAALVPVARLVDLFGADLVTLDEPASGLRFLSGSTDVTSHVVHALLYSPSGSHTYLVYSGDPGRSTVDVEVTTASMTQPKVRDPITGATESPTVVQPAGEGKPSRLTLRLSEHPLILDFNFGEPAHASAAETQQLTLPSVEQIIARHQQAQASQDAVLQNYIAHMRMEQHFRPSPADPAYNEVTENRLFWDTTGAEWEQLSFSLNGATWTHNPPAGPLLQAEKVLSLPLDLRLTRDYRYALDGVERVGDREAFVVRFDPLGRSQALYRGRVWIDRGTWLRLKVEATETRGSGVVVSHSEEQTFAPVGEVAGQPIWLADRFVIHEVFLVASSNISVERDITLSDVRLNAPDFETSRAAARASDRVMLRDTDQGVRYFVKKGERRVVSSELTTSARAMAMGADIDPSFDYPLPIAGLDILDFNFLHRDMQLALLFGGVIAIGNIQHANLWGGRFDASVDFFGLALKANDAVFDSQGERRGERVRAIPLSTGAKIGYQLTTFQKLTGRCELRYDAYFRDAGTSPTFVAPSSTATSGEEAGYEYRRRGLSVTGNVSAHQRSSWTSWGAAGTTFDPATRTYTRYDAGVSKDFVFATFHTIHLNGEYFGGQRLDRFSMYQFGLFDPTRMHGVPSAVRFGELAMLRGSYSFNLFDQYRFDLFLDHAVGRDRELDNRWRPVTGLGLGVSLRGPRSTIVRADIGKSFLPDIYRGAGSLVIQVLVLKPL